jgi:3-oxoadipate enol-lactonase
VFAEANGVRLHYEVAGEAGPAVLLVHGLGGQLRWWGAVASLLAPVCRVVQVDLRGHGLSDKPPGPYSIKLWSDDLAALCAAIGVERCVAVGSSVSGAVVLQLAADHPALVQGVVPVGGFPALPPAGKERMTQRAAAVDEKGMEAVADLVLAAALAPSTQASNAGLVALAKASLLANDPRAYATATRAVAVADVREALPKVKCPAMIVFGVEEKVAPLGAQTALKKGIPHATLRAVPGAGHLPFLEQPGIFAGALMEFLAGL